MLKTFCIALAIFALSLAAPRPKAQQIAITFDDLPAHGPLPPGITRLQVAQTVIAALKDAGVPPVYGFVNGKTFDENADGAAVLDAWRQAGNPLGSHTWSHMDLNKSTLEAWEADTLRNEPYLTGRMAGADWRWMRFPFLSEGDTQDKRQGARAFLKQHGYRIAGVTMSFGDYAWNEPYARCRSRQQEAGVGILEQTYLDAARDDIQYRRALARMAFGHDIPYVLLMHLGAMDARMLPKLLALYKSAGFRFVTLEEAMADPFYANDLDLSLPQSPDSLEAAAKAKSTSPLPKHRTLSPELYTLCQ